MISHENVQAPPECYILPRNRTTNRLMDLVCDERNLSPLGWMRHAQRLQDHLDERMALYGPVSVQERNGSLDTALVLKTRQQRPSLQG